MVRDGNAILDDIDWSVESDERWVILGPNGAGKTTLLQIAAAAMHPTKGSAEVLQESLGKVDVFELRPMIGPRRPRWPAAHPEERDGHRHRAHGRLLGHGRWNEEYEAIDDRREARAQRVGPEGFAGRCFGSLDGEQKRVQIGRSGS